MRNATQLNLYAMYTIASKSIKAITQMQTRTVNKHQARFIVYDCLYLIVDINNMRSIICKMLTESKITTIADLQMICVVEFIWTICKIVLKQNLLQTVC